jgi:hypothetical protein
MTFSDGMLVLFSAITFLRCLTESGGVVSIVIVTLIAL